MEGSAERPEESVMVTLTRKPHGMGRLPGSYGGIPPAGGGKLQYPAVRLIGAPAGKGPRSNAVDGVLSGPRGDSIMLLPL